MGAHINHAGYVTIRMDDGFGNLLMQAPLQPSSVLGPPAMIRGDSVSAGTWPLAHFDFVAMSSLQAETLLLLCW